MAVAVLVLAALVLYSMLGIEAVKAPAKQSFRYRDYFNDVVHLGKFLFEKNYIIHNYAKKMSLNS